QAEDGIRDRNVTGVQTCALLISEEGDGGGVVGGFGVGAAGIVKRFPVFVGDYEGVVFVFDVHGLLRVGRINADVLAVVEEQYLGSELRVALGSLDQQCVA